ncbi:MAG: metallophosphoesterase [Candidatus Micrarchaeia archaeon]
MDKANKIALVLFPFILALYVAFIEPNTIYERDLQISANVDAPLRVLFFSDSHYPAIPAGFFEKVRSARPDAILFGGDISSELSEVVYQISPQENERKYAEFFQNLSKIAPVYVVRGNHDYYSAKLQNVTYLNGNAAVLRGLKICGTDYYGYSNESNCDIEVVHSIERIGSVENASLSLLGHTHAGSMYIPIMTEWILSQKLCSECGKYRYGEQNADGKRIFTTSGIAAYPRFLAPPEIVVVDVGLK